MPEPVNDLPSAFTTATELMDSVYTTAVLHCIAELRGSHWHNLYTSVTFGREIDQLSVPPELDHREYSPRPEGEYRSKTVCLRQRVERAEARSILDSARRGSVELGSWTIQYELVEIVPGFRPASVPSDFNEKSFWDTSFWSREHIGLRKEYDGRTLRKSNAWKVAEYLRFLEEARWLPIPLPRHPEKLGDLDEIWPSPISVEVSTKGSLKVVCLAPFFNEHEIITTGTLLRDDLIVGAVHFYGVGPHALGEDFHGVNLLTTLDGVPIYAGSNRFMRAFKMSTTMYGRNTYHVPAHKARKELNVLIPSRQEIPRIIGEPTSTPVRHEAWETGRLFRRLREPDDAEHVYDPSDPDAFVQAYRHLQQYGTGEESPRIVVADPYALNEHALHAIAVMSIRENRTPTVHILTHFDSAGSASEESLSSRGESGRGLTAREETIKTAKETAQKIASQLRLKFAFYKIEKLHDRFLVVGERLWHVGGSFNQLGQEIMAVVEMRDEKAKDAVIKIFEKYLAKSPEFEVQP